MPYKDLEARRRYQREWVANNRAEWLKGKSCVDCGSKQLLEVDHIDPQSKISHRIWSWSRDRRDTELAKCVIRCRGCHQIKTVTGLERAHGEASGRSKLTTEQVLEIRERSPAESARSLGREFGVSDFAIRAILIRKTWSHI